MPRPYYHSMLMDHILRDNADRQRLARLARAILLFHQGGPWTAEDSREWELLTGSTEATTKTLCDFAEHLLMQPRDP